LLLDEEIRSFVEGGARGNIAILGAVGSGKTTALAQLAAMLPPDVFDEQVALLDEPARCQLADKPVRLVVYTACRCFPDVSHLAVYGLAPWNRDDLIEYLLTVHRPRCASVMARVCGDDRLLLGGLPELWRIVLDRLAAEDALPDVRRALHRHLEEHLTDTDLLERARSACLNVAVTPKLYLADAVREIVRLGFAESLIRLLRHPPMQQLLAGERIAADLHAEADCDYLAKRLPRELIEATGRLIAADGRRALAHLHALLAGPSWSHAMAISLLHAAGASANWKDSIPSQLAGAYLHGVFWPEGKLRDANLFEADFSAANLSGADLTGAIASNIRLCLANLQGACVTQIIAIQADAQDADLSGVHGEQADFSGANLEQADFSDAQLPHVTFTNSNLTAAVFLGAKLCHAIFSSAILQDADFTDADLSGAVLSGLRLTESHWEGARFAQAQLDGCDLEYMVLPWADFEEAKLRGALLTGSTMFGGNFRGASLRNAGLADIEWENACLCDADLRGASFHMGSTRSGLVGSTIPCEGSKTGFYTDDYEEQTYKAPEEIRKANLCGADLRGAILDGVDFYLVDLRGALYDAKYKEHLRRCGAILEARV
jgi:uncharacterized protein YjbI with pentapeptide repeats